jgi:hypothetical protein
MERNVEVTTLLVVYDARSMSRSDRSLEFILRVRGQGLPASRSGEG